ncbi:helix-turn-helix domain-containing protein [Nonomuraea sp. NPDC048916]|uniref:TetR/AcrR family transcriptional regulator n=1 Tax=Nonomuraea sp. NPDC048916 TaxID=3154232 RepID=UPI0034073A88
MHAKHPAGRRERNRDAMRARVYEAAVSLFGEKGFTATSFDDIAERADVARATVFNHFRRKDEFLLAWGDERRRRLSALLIQESTREVGVVNQLTRCMRALSDVTTQERALTSELLLAWVRTGAPVLEEPYSAYVFAQIVTDGKARGEVRPDVDPVMAGQLIRDMYLGTLYRWVGASAEPPFSLAEAMTGALRLIFDGILTRPRATSES